MHLINTWNIFSRSLLMQEYLQKSTSSLVITKADNIAKYKKIFSFLEVPLWEISNLSELIFCIKNEFWNYIINYDIVFIHLENMYQLENKQSISLLKGWNIILDDFIKQLTNFWYIFREFLEWWDYKKLWDTLHIKINKNSPEIIISFWWDTIENIFLDGKELVKITLWEIQPLNFFDLKETFQKETFEYIKQKKLILDNIDILPWGENFESLEYAISLDILKKTHVHQENLVIQDVFIDTLEKLTHTLAQIKNGTIYTKHPQTLWNYLEYNLLWHIKVFPTSLNILKSFQSPDKLIICDDILSKIFVKKRVKKKISQDIDLMLQITPGDYIVHRDHGIGVYHGIIKKTHSKSEKEYLEIEYKWSDKLFVPITEIARVSKYIGKENPNLTGLSTKEWTKKLEKVWDDVQKIAQELLEIYAKRQLTKWFSFFDDRQKMREFEASFEFEYTPDQLQAMKDIQHDMEKNIPMERILVWDVWFWKTEVAFSAIYRAFLNKKQSILISPLVVLAYEHYQKACERFSNFPLKIDLLTRFQTQSEAKIILEKLKDWKIDLIIGTHRLLSEHIEYKDLWLLVIDEEHKFWVSQKEQLKKFRFSDEKNLSSKNWIDILSMSATPIPRSLNMALSWVRSFSLLSKAPLMRKWVETFVSKFEEKIIVQAIKNEFSRSGQVFFIHNRVETIHAMEEYLKWLFPNKKIVVTHGKLPWDELEERILYFKQKKYDILISSTVIENGIDFPNVNTIIINDAYKFGISQIHQLRGRVGRWDQLGYCYLLYRGDTLSPDGAKRLTTLVEYSHLWAWFELALRDLEIRGGGDILWLNQSWLTSEVGLSVYLQMLEDKIEQLKEDTNISQETLPNTLKLPTIDLNIDVYFSDEYFDSELDKLNFFREIEYITSMEELQDMKQNFIASHSNITSLQNNLFTLLEVRILAEPYQIRSIKRNWVSYEIIFDANTHLEQLKNFLDLDTKVIFYVESLQKIKTSCKNFWWDNLFLDYLQTILLSKNNPSYQIENVKKSSKIKLKNKK